MMQYLEVEEEGSAVYGASEGGLDGANVCEERCCRFWTDGG